ncbi:MAG: glycosyltransferase family 4 protein [Acidobacteria bacterium]|nr:glycosyltransferase family 4 protein [Acidobacteriota bacterium]
MRVLGLCSYPIEAAATRYRLAQFVEPLAARGIELEMSPFLDSRRFARLYEGSSPFEKVFGLGGPLVKRLSEVLKARRYDALFVQREAMLFGPAVFEWLLQRAGRLPLVLDLDDATYIPYESPTYGRLGSFFKFFGKTDRLIERAETVICGNRFIAEYVEKKGTKTAIVPTVVDTDKFVPVEKDNAVPVLGWIGTHSTFPLLESIFPVLQRLAAEHRFVLRIVGAGRPDVALAGVEIDNRPWSLEREVRDFQTLDVGLYPIAVSASASNEWLLGKSGFKAIQYLTVGIPYVVTPVGVCAEIGIEGETHFFARTEDEWFASLSALLESAELRRKMGAKGRENALENYTISQQVNKIADTLKGLPKS